MKLYNTISRKKELFKPSTKKVGFYACGPTVYNYAHLGNLRAFLFADLLRRTLLLNNYDVNFVMNITDVGHLTDDADDGEDKMEKGSKREGRSVWEIADYYTEAFKKDCSDLNILEPDVLCKATDHIEEQIKLINNIEANGFTYRTSDGIYFDTSKLKDYGKLIPNFNPDDLQAGKRVTLGEKKNITDFALWKFSPEDEKRQMEWDSPWGRGFPGWHIECTAMACKYLGEEFDIHTGGIDHIPVHHTNEIAQAQGAFGKDHVRYWLHSEFLLAKEGKMAKSKGNFLRLETIKEKDFEPLDFRYFLLLTHYRKQVSFSFDGLKAARNARLRLNNKFNSLKSGEKVDVAFKNKFLECVNDDLNIPKGLALLNELLDSTLSDGVKRTTALYFDSVLGLDLANSSIEIPDDVKKLADKRLEAKADKDFKKADALRVLIEKKGFRVNDKKDGYDLIIM